MNTDMGFTGTAKTLTPEQEVWLATQLKAAREAGFLTLHHGDCVGADAAAHDIALGLGFRIVVHPPDVDGWRAWKVGNFTHPTATYRQRNADIVRASHALLALPEGPEKSYPYSGSWMTVRMARKAELPMTVWPEVPTAREEDPLVAKRAKAAAAKRRQRAAKKALVNH